MHKDDRELLELAAKATGYDTRHPWNGERMLMDPPVVGLCITDVSTNWNPLDHDSDALRLATRLNLIVEPGTCWITKFGPVFREDVLPDPYAATRRAIVRAAAEIGRGMK